MTSRLRLQKDKTAKQKGKQQVCLCWFVQPAQTMQTLRCAADTSLLAKVPNEEAQIDEQALFASLKGAAPGTAGKPLMCVCMF